MSIKKQETCEMHLRVVLEGLQSLEQTEAISGESPLVSVECSERRRLTSECGYSPAWENFMNSGAHKNLFGDLIFTVQ